MNKLAAILISGSVSLLAMQPIQSRKNKVRPNRKPEIISFSSSLEAIVRCYPPNLDESVCTPGKTSLKVDATDADGDHLTYQYSVTGGEIVGKGPSVIWNLDEVANGMFRAYVVVTDGKGGESRAEVSLNVLDGPHRELVPPPCPEVSVQCPDEILRGRNTFFSASVTVDGKTVSPARYDWTVNWGEIASGQGTARIEVKLKEDWGEKLTATVFVGGYDPSCWAKGSCSSKMTSRGATALRLMRARTYSQGSRSGNPGLWGETASRYKPMRGRNRCALVNTQPSLTTGQRASERLLKVFTPAKLKRRDGF